MSNELPSNGELNPGIYLIGNDIVYLRRYFNGGKCLYSSESITKLTEDLISPEDLIGYQPLSKGQLLWLKLKLNLFKKEETINPEFIESIEDDEREILEKILEK